MADLQTLRKQKAGLNQNEAAERFAKNMLELFEK